MTSKTKKVTQFIPQNGGRRSSKKRAKSEKGAARRARGVATEQVVAPESKGVIGVKVRSSASGQVAGFPKVSRKGHPGRRDEETSKTRDQKMMKSRRGYKWISQNVNWGRSEIYEVCKTNSWILL
jgi:hypothetical protein